LQEVFMWDESKAESVMLQVLVHISIQYTWLLDCYLYLKGSHLWIFYFGWMVQGTRYGV
jgi:hypothetical protein